MTNPRNNKPIITRTTLMTGLRSLGLGQGSDDVVMVHTSMSSMGWVVGGPQTIVASLLDVLGPGGTLLVYTDWEDGPTDNPGEWDAELYQAYREECPAYDPRVARAAKYVGRVPETVRTWPGVRRSIHPSWGFSAVGARARYLVEGQALTAGAGPGSPLERLVECEGAVLMLGAPLDTVTLLHYAEYLADAPNKQWLEYHMPVLVNEQRVWHPFRELCSWNDPNGAFLYEELNLDDDAFAVISRDALKHGIGARGQIGAGAVHLLPARPLVDHAVKWLEARFGGGSS